MFSLALGDTSSGFEAEWRFLADRQGLGTDAGRYPSADLLPLFNDSYQRLINLVSGLGYTQHLERGTTTALPTSAVEAGEQYAVVDSVVGYDQLVAVDVLIGGGDWRRLEEVPFGQLRNWTSQDWVGGQTHPEAWCWLNAGTVSEDTFTAGQIAIAPVPASGSYCLWYMPTKTRLDETDDVFLYHTADWKKWHMYDVLSEIAGVKDKNSEKRLQRIDMQLNPNVFGSPAYNIVKHAPTRAGPRTWTRSRNYRGRWGR